ncbi:MULTISPECIES: DUF1146 family protein [Bacillus]|uniref:DUF1146 domain-containing protein n=1 Tax=Bacillus glycinifermentans TaxID=1664069 RepID=A0AAJ3Z259_9BACI|nr:MULTISPECIES: DUF1146 family protein [Bacillus]KKB74271.1 membrane protein [Bacillus sp. TH008]MBU8787654.1 DUF1146 family protein [Bacillus glycinifermentans]MDU0071877.1 DUF1146 family protein [Bacillus sp. IG6]MEC3607944.1 DUF1146 family protein [Bacillus glycinifermentans]MED8019502.1 DUF1146 family protein [Bacillus glycinifermentans]
MEEIGQQAAVSIFVHLFFIALTWWALLAVNIDPLIRKGKILQARLLMILLTIAIGSTVSNFFLDYLYYSKQLQNLFL